MADELRSDDIRSLLYQSESEDESSIFAGDDTDSDPDFVLEETDNSDTESAEEEEDERAPGGRQRNVAALLGKNGYKWSSEEPVRRGRPLARNSIVHLPGGKGIGKEVTNPLDSWKVQISKEIIDEIVLRTNEEITKNVLFMQNIQGCNHATNEVEILAFIGLLYLCGVDKNSHRNLQELWSLTFGLSVYRATMSLNRFCFLAKCLRFDDKRTRAERKNTDKFAPIRKIWDIFVNNAKTSYSPFENCTLDEQLVGFRGRCPFRVYMKNKPDQYGIKIFMLNDSRTSYMINAMPHVGKVNPLENEDIPSYYVRNITEPIHGTKRNVTVDNYFTSVPLFQSMLVNNKLTMVGAIRKNKREIPPSFVAPKKQDSSLFAFDGNKMLVSFSPKPRKNVLLLSTLHQSKEVDEASGKPSVILFYNSTKGDTDTFDQLCHAYTVHRRTKRWPMGIFYAMLDQSAINAMVLYSLKVENKKKSRRKFLQELSLSLIKPLLQERITSTTLRRNIRSMICSILGINNEERRRMPQEERRQRRCCFCDRKKDKKTNQTCTSCHRAMCDEHRVELCYECLD